VVSLATGRKKGVLEIKEKERERGSGKGSPPWPFEHLGCVARHRALSQGCDRVGQFLGTVNRCCGRTTEGLSPHV
jgi:hypothetical protein